jgi:hypothetical protein
VPDNQGVTHCVNQDTQLRISENYVDAFRKQGKICEKATMLCSSDFQISGLRALLGFEK